MLLEGFVAIMAMIAACVLQPGVYFAVNSPAGIVGATPQAAVATITAWGFPVTAEQMAALARDVGEQTPVPAHRRRAVAGARHGAHLRRGPGGEAVLGFWYHFAIMFEALFILTILDAGTRVGRFMLQELLGHVCEPLGRRQLDARRARLERRHRARLGLLPVSGRPGPAGRHQLAVAAVRHRQPVARGHRAVGVPPRF